MPEITTPYEPGVPCWVDLMAPDQQAALDFYRDLFGWQGQVGPPETGGYSVCTMRGKAVAGIMQTMAEEGAPAPPTAWTTYLACADVDEGAQAVENGGGTVTMPGTDVMDLGRMAAAADPTGAPFGLWQARTFIGSQLVNEPGSVVWSELDTADPEAADSFYQGLGITTFPMEDAPDYYALEAGGRMVGGMRPLEEDDPPDAGSHWLTYFAVDDTDSTVDALTRAGGSVIRPPFDMMAGRMAVVQDPQGAEFALINPMPPNGA